MNSRLLDCGASEVRAKVYSHNHRAPFVDVLFTNLRLSACYIAILFPCQRGEAKNELLIKIKHPPKLSSTDRKRDPMETKGLTRSASTEGN